VLPNAQGEAPLETFIDDAAEVNRQNPQEPADKPLTYDDYKSVAEQIRQFLTDGDRGLERLYKVIQGRDLSKPQPQAQAPAQTQAQQAAN
jgi:hypothetical protein